MALDDRPGEPQNQRVEELHLKLREAEVEEAMKKLSATMHRVTPDSEQCESVVLGPIPYTEVEFEGRSVKALIDTGSPVTIVSLEFSLRALANQRQPSQPSAEW